MNPIYTEILKKYLGNELLFLYKLYNLVLDINQKKEGTIDSSKINGNELYVIFSGEVGNKEKGWK